MADTTKTLDLLKASLHYSQRVNDVRNAEVLSAAIGAIESQQSALAAQREEIARLRELFAEYGDHKPYCDGAHSYTARMKTVCECGFTKALATKEADK